jgi:predicted transposase YbfD/YdcC
MEANAPRDLLRYFRDLADPRPRHNVMHSFADILTLSLLAVIGGAQGPADIERFGQAKHDWLKTFLDLPHGIPSHDTIGRVLAALDPDAFERCFIAWTQAIARHTTGRLIAVDGKTLRGSFDHAHGKAAIHMVSAWCVKNQMALGQVTTEAKSNEITAVPKLLELLDLRGATVTADAMHCQKKIARQIHQAGGDYLLQVKANQPTILDEMKLFFDQAIEAGFDSMAYAKAQTVDKGHGRVETRTCYSTWDIDWFQDRKRWDGLRSFVCVESTRWIDGKQTTERRYYFSSHDGRDARFMLEATRGHWGVENALHWRLDVTYREDDSRLRQGHADENFSRLRRLAMNLLRAEGRKESLRGKMKICGWDNEYLLKVLTAGATESPGQRQA